MANEPVVHVIDDDAAARESLLFLLDCARMRVKGHVSADSFLAALPPARAWRHRHRRAHADERDRAGRSAQGVGIADPVIVITGHADVPMAIHAMKQGVADFIEKPFGDEVILDSIRSALTRHDRVAGQQAERDRVRERLAALSPRERDVLDGLVGAVPNKVIAFDLGISARTVEVYRANLMTKMQAEAFRAVRMAMVAKQD